MAATAAVVATPRWNVACISSKRITAGEARACRTGVERVSALAVAQSAAANKVRSMAAELGGAAVNWLGGSIAFHDPQAPPDSDAYGQETRQFTYSAQGRTLGTPSVQLFATQKYSTHGSTTGTVYSRAGPMRKRSRVPLLRLPAPSAAPAL